MTLVEPRPAPPVEQEERGGWLTPGRVGWAGVVLGCLAFFVALPPILIRSPIPTVITVYADRSFSFTTKTPPASFLLKKAAKIHEAMTSSPRRPRAPTERMIATGPVQAKRNATTAFDAYRAPESANTCRGRGTGVTAGSSGIFVVIGAARIERWRVASAS